MQVNSAETSASWDEAALIKLATEGDTLSLERLLQRHHGRFCNTVRIPTSLQAMITVEDVLQETYLHVFRRIRTFSLRNNGSFVAWVSAIANAQLINIYAGQHTQKRGSGRVYHEAALVGITFDEAAVAVLLDELAVYNRTPSASAVAHELNVCLHEALRSLPEHYRTAIQLRYFEDTSIATLATTIGRTEGATLMLLQRAIKTLGQILEDPETGQ